LKRNIGDAGVENKALFDVFNRVLALQMKVCYFEMFK
jgi:hypothetical protein